MLRAFGEVRVRALNKFFCRTSGSILLVLRLIFPEVGLGFEDD